MSDEKSEGVLNLPPEPHHIAGVPARNLTTDSTTPAGQLPGETSGVLKDELGYYRIAAYVFSKDEIERMDIASMPPAIRTKLCIVQDADGTWVRRFRVDLNHQKATADWKFPTNGEVSDATAALANKTLRDFPSDGLFTSRMNQKELTPEQEAALAAEKARIKLRNEQRIESLAGALNALDVNPDTIKALATEMTKVPSGIVLGPRDYADIENLVVSYLSANTDIADRRLRSIAHNLSLALFERLYANVQEYTIAQSTELRAVIGRLLSDIESGAQWSVAEASGGFVTAELKPTTGVTGEVVPPTGVGVKGEMADASYTIGINSMMRQDD